jgi:glycosyltransferase involved in cell wall biosynthesis
MNQTFEAPQFVDVSILLTCFNKVDFMTKQLDFIKKVLIKGYEVIVVDDGSTDGSTLYLEEFRRDNPTLIYLQQANQGSAAARNEALSRVSRKYFVFLDFDDLLNLSTLEKAIPFLESFNPALARLNYRVAPSSTPESEDAPLDGPITSPIHSMRDEIYDRMGYWRYIYSRKLLDEMQLRFTPTFGEVEGYFILDDVFWLLHNSSLDLECLMFPESWILYNYYVDPIPTKDGWLRFQKQAVLMPKAASVFLEYLDECKHDHDLNWLGSKLYSVIKSHLYFLNLKQLISVLPLFYKLTSNNKKLFFAEKNHSIFLIITRLLLISCKNSLRELLSRVRFGRMLLKGFQGAKKRRS